MDGVIPPNHSASSGSTGPDTCRCPCHKGVVLAHPVPCCTYCPSCKQNIAFTKYAAHVEHCQGSGRR